MESLFRWRPAGLLAPTHLKLRPRIKVAFASGTDELNARLIERMRQEFPEMPLYVVSEFPPAGSDLEWIPYHINRGFAENWRRARAALRGKKIRLAGVLLVPNVPFRRMRLLALVLAPLHFLAVNENLNDFMLRPRCMPTMARHFLWRARNFWNWHFGPQGTLARRDWQADRVVLTAKLLAALRRRKSRRRILPQRPMEPGISVLIPSRNGKNLLAAHLPGILAQLPQHSEVIIVDNGSDDGTAAWLASLLPNVRTEISCEPVSFAAAVNRGIAVARYSHIALLNNDMALDPGFFEALRRAFDQIPELFCATAQIRFPAGMRRQETGKAVMAQNHALDFPLRCDEPLPGEDLTYVLYGSGGCSLYDAAKLRDLGGLDEIYAPAYVEDLDVGYRAWQRGWPSVYVAGAIVEHRHRATTSRYYTEEQLAAILERNYLTFLVRSIWDRKLFRSLWAQALGRLRMRGDHAALRAARDALLEQKCVAEPPVRNEDLILALGNGSVHVFPGRASADKPRVLIASPYVPFPLSHGGAVRIYNLMRRAAADFDQILIAFTEAPAAAPRELLNCCAEIVLVHRIGMHSPPARGRPDVVEEFASASFQAALEETVRKWQPAIVQLEFTQMGQYAPVCGTLRTVLVEHDVTLDLYAQLLALEDNWDLRRQLALWRRFETAVWRQVSCVVTMSNKDRAVIQGARAVTLPNGVDLDRFQPVLEEPEARRLLFVGSFAHLPNLLALEFFLNGVWPRLRGATLEIIAGAGHECFLARYKGRAKINLNQPGLEVQGFVADVRPAYQRAAVVIAPLVASAGTNIKILEAMAMGKAIISTPAGVNGLDLNPGEDFILAKTPDEMVQAIQALLADPARRKRLEAAARRRVERDFSWDEIARRQAALYRELL